MADLGSSLFKLTPLGLSPYSLSPLLALGNQNLAYTDSNSPPKIKQIKHPHSVWDHITWWSQFWCYLTLSAGKLSLWSSSNCSIGLWTQWYNICSLLASLMDKWHWAHNLERYALAKISGKNQLCTKFRGKSWSVFCFCCCYFCCFVFIFVF